MLAASDEKSARNETTIAFISSSVNKYLDYFWDLAVRKNAGICVVVVIVRVHRIKFSCSCSCKLNSYSYIQI